MTADVVALCDGTGNSPKALPLSALGANVRSLSTFTRLRTLARDYDVVVAHGSSTLEACALALAGSRTPFIYKSIGDSSYWVRTWRQRTGTQAFLRRAAGIVTLWPEAARFMHDQYGIQLDKLHTIPNGVCADDFPRATPAQRQDARRELGIPEEATSLAYVGALSDEKDVGLAIRAASEIPNTYLNIAGQGPRQLELEGLAVRRAPGRVRFLGAVDDVMVIYRSADLLLLPSKSEGMPSVIIQAGMVGTSTVATQVGAIPSMLADGETGYLAPVGNPEAFIGAVRRALKTSNGTGLAAADEFRSRYGLHISACAWLQTIEQVKEESVWG